ncbi:hypothetical protein P154DRAFT_579100 [Amniculicola lignicola CBS 123094]|uniref:Ankyrin n=1 Tax=Amniculicola lignicola CBS 123094 TaxID=1392246 RepID=A0A6A5W8K2_9PLEO|nr:hypothetical protein P154DRAFT_579100 [Amniculicola lignicola CBS 123094]
MTFDNTSLDDVLWFMTNKAPKWSYGLSHGRLLPWRWDMEDIPKYAFAVAVTVPYTALYTSMLEHGFDPHFVTEHFGSPLECLARLNRMEPIRQLLDAKSAACPALVSRLPRDSFITAVTLGNVDTVKLLVEPRYGLVQNALICLKAALRAMEDPICTKEQHDTATLVLEPHPVLPRRWLRMRTGLCIFAARRNHDWILNRYLTSDINGIEVFRESLTHGECSIPVVQFLLSRGAEVRGTPKGVVQNYLSFAAKLSLLAGLKRFCSLAILPEIR